MTPLEPSTRWLTELDHVRLLKLTGEYPPEVLGELLDVAETVPSTDIDPDVVTMNSQVLVSDEASGEQRKLTVCYPDDAEPNRGFVSVLSPVGLALLGQRVGTPVTTFTPAGQQRSLHIDAILFQPEATGDYIT